MTKQLDVIVANPAGNTTILVVSPVEIEDYQYISDKLLEIDFGNEYNVHFSENDSNSIFGEQVGFILPYCSETDSVPSMNMSGLEFCGNASRSFAYYRAAKFGDGDLQPDGTRKLQVKVSGCDHPLTAFINIDKSEAKIKMPIPTDVVSFTAEELKLSQENPDLQDTYMIDMGGISHLVLKNIEATPDKFEKIKNYVYKKCGDLPAFGVMFMDKSSKSITPVVYVKDINTTYFEGSCASGTTAAAFGIVYDKPDGEYNFPFFEPAGTLYTNVTKKNGLITELELYSHLEISDIITVEI